MVMPKLYFHNFQTTLIFAFSFSPLSPPPPSFVCRFISTSVRSFLVPNFCATQVNQKYKFSENQLSVFTCVTYISSLEYCVGITATNMHQTNRQDPYVQELRDEHYNACKMSSSSFSFNPLLAGHTSIPHIWGIAFRALSVCVLHVFLYAMHESNPETFSFTEMVRTVGVSIQILAKRWLWKRPTRKFPCALRSDSFAVTCHCEVRISCGPVIMTAHINGGDDCACWAAPLSFCCSLRIVARAPLSRLSVGEALDKVLRAESDSDDDDDFLPLYSTLLCFALRLVMEGILSH